MTTETTHPTFVLTDDMLPDVATWGYWQDHFTSAHGDFDQMRGVISDLRYAQMLFNLDDFSDEIAEAQFLLEAQLARQHKPTELPARQRRIPQVIHWLDLAFSRVEEEMVASIVQQPFITELVFYLSFVDGGASRGDAVVRCSTLLAKNPMLPFVVLSVSDSRKNDIRSRIANLLNRSRSVFVGAYGFSDQQYDALMNVLSPDLLTKWSQTRGVSHLVEPFFQQPKSRYSDQGFNYFHSRFAEKVPTLDLMVYWREWMVLWKAAAKRKKLDVGPPPHPFLEACLETFDLGGPTS